MAFLASFFFLALLRIFLAFLLRLLEALLIDELDEMLDSDELEELSLKFTAYFELLTKEFGFKFISI